MTTTLAFEVFDILQDKYGAPYFPDDWKVKLFNKAQFAYLGQVIPDNQGGRVNVELDSNVAHNVAPLIFPLSVNSSSGLVSNAVLASALASASHAGAKVSRILNIRAGDYPVRWARHNNIWEYYANTFKHPRSPDKIRFTIESTGLRFYPTDDSVSLSITVLKEPKQVSLSVDPEFSDYVCYEIIKIMLLDAGVSVRDEELIAAVNATA